MKKVRENLYEKFSEDSDPIKDMGVGTIEINLVYNNFYIDKQKNGKYVPDLSEEDTAYAIKELNNIGIKWEIKGPAPSFHHPFTNRVEDMPTRTMLTEIKFVGTPKQIARMIVDIYYGSGSVSEIEEKILQWDGKDEEKFWELIDPLVL